MVSSKLNASLVANRTVANTYNKYEIMFRVDIINEAQKL